MGIIFHTVTICLFLRKTLLCLTINFHYNEEKICQCKQRKKEIRIHFLGIKHSPQPRRISKDILEHNFIIKGGGDLEVLTGRQPRRRKYVRVLLIIAFVMLTLCLLLLLTIYMYAKTLGPPPLAVPQSTIYYAADGTVIGESNNGQKRYWVELDNVSPHLIDATISIEDKRFYRHFGIDFKRIGGAIIADIKAMSKVQGASTITQQYARNLFLEHDKSWKRKLREMFYALRLELNYSKETILEGYLNTINYGHGAYGVEAASQFYFGKSAANLSLAEATMLAGIPKGPGNYSPLISMEKATQRQHTIIHTMVKNGFINEEVATKTKATELTFVGEHLHRRNELAPYFQDAVQAVLTNQLGMNEQTIALGGLKVYTTLDLEEQVAAEQVIKEMIDANSSMQVGFVAMNPQNGFVTAMVGGTNYDASPFNRAVQATRQPGSIIKPFLYYAALEHGFTPASTMRSEKTTFHFDNGLPPYTPSNFNNRYANSEITMAQALALSDNIFAVKTHLFLGEDILVKTAERFGITTKMNRVPSLALGTSDVRVIDMATAFSLLANGGKQIEPILIKRIENYQGEVIYEYKQKKTAILKPDLAFVITHMMTGVFDPKLNGYATVTGHSMIKRMTRPYAGKSGTTDTDSWMVGFSPNRTAAVWTGFDKGKHLKSVKERQVAKNIWIQFMEQTHRDLAIKNFTPPKGTIGVEINPENGLLATPDCPVKRLTYFVEGTEPVEYCKEHGNKLPKKHYQPKKQKKLPWYKRLFQWDKE